MSANGATPTPADWPFADPPDQAVITVRQVLSGSPILRVCHDAADYGWQFLTGVPVEISDAQIVGLQEIADLDPSVKGLADLPFGWCAVRDAPGSPWQREQMASEEDEA